MIILLVGPQDHNKVTMNIAMYKERTRVAKGKMKEASSYFCSASK